MTPVEFRRQLHRHPELSFREEATARFIEEQLAAAGIACRRIAGTGVLARIEGKRNAAAPAEAARQAVVLRADIDALPVAEQTGLPYASENPGVMHACGHDLHAAVLFGVLQRMAANPDFCGTLFGLFQPGEELVPGGASLVLQENPFDGYAVRAVIGEHVEPQLEVGTLGFRAGQYMAANDELRFRVRGVGGHGALRAQLKDPVAAAVQLVARLLELNDGTTILSVGKIDAPGATNVIPDEVYLEGTLRTFDEAFRSELHRRIEAIAEAVDRAAGTQTAIEIGHGYPCVVNDAALVELAAARAEAEGLRVERLPLRATSEDFGFYCRHYPSLFYRLGVGTSAGRTHTAAFNPDERAIGTGIGFMQQLALQLLNQ